MNADRKTQVISKLTNQNGASIIAAIFIIVILGFMGLMFVTMIGTGSLSSVNDFQASQAFHVAEGGVEYAMRFLSAGTACNLLSYTLNLGTGSFTTTGTPAAPNCIIRSVGMVGNARRTMEVTAASGGAALYEPFPAGSVPVDTAGANSCTSSPALSWCYSYSNTGGSSAYNAASQVADGTGSLIAITTTGRNNRFSGYRQKTLPSPVPAGSVLTLSMQYKKNYSAIAARDQEIEIQLVYSDGTVVTPPGWSNTAISNANTWTALTPASFTIPAGSTVTAVRAYFLERNGNDNVASTSVWFDEVRLTAPGGAIVLSWQEVIN